MRNQSPSHKQAAVQRRWTMPLLGAVALALSVSGPAFADDLQLQAVQVSPSQSANQTELVLVLNESSSNSAISSFLRLDPVQLVIDIADAASAAEIADAVSDGGLITDISVETLEMDDGILSRVVVSLSGPVEHQLTKNGNEVRILIERSAQSSDDPLATTSSAGAATTSGASNAGQDPFLATDANEDRPLSGPEDIDRSVSLTSLDFDKGQTSDRIIVGVKGTAEFSDTRPRPSTLIIDVPGAFVPQSLTRPVDTSRFVSPIRSIRAYRTSSGARITVTLRSDVEYEIQRSGDGLLVIDVPVPASMQEERRRATENGFTVAPSGGGSGDGGISNASREELLIGGSGRTADPNAAFAAGYGSTSGTSRIGADGFMYDSSSATDLPYTGRQISLDFVNADIHSIFRLISSVSRLNIVAGDDVSGTVTVRMENVPWDQALAAILQAKGLASQRYGNIVRVAPLETLKTERQMALEAKRATEELEELQVLILPLNYSSGADVVDNISSTLSARGSVEVDSRGNQLIITDTEDVLAQIREIVRQVDRQTPQVLIEARIVEASTTFTRGMGVQWGSELDASTATGYSTGLFFPNSVGVSGALTRESANTFYERGQESLLVDLGPDAANSGIAFSLGSIPGLVDLDARLAALESDGYGKVISSPRVTTLDNQQAMVTQGQRIPYLSTSAGGVNVQFVNATLDLQVTPHITNDDQVFLNVRITNNRPDFSVQVQGQPAVQIKEVTTQVLVMNGDTTVLGGVFSTEDSFTQDRVPGLYKIPLLGYLFRNSSRNTNRNELLVFITPHIVNDTSLAENQ